MPKQHVPERNKTGSGVCRDACGECARWDLGSAAGDCTGSEKKQGFRWRSEIAQKLCRISDRTTKSRKRCCRFRVASFRNVASQCSPHHACACVPFHFTPKMAAFMAHAAGATVTPRASAPSSSPHPYRGSSPVRAGSMGPKNYKNGTRHRTIARGGELSWDEAENVLSME
jgi:hypothetical protein